MSAAAPDEDFEWKREITELWTLKMKDSDYLQKLVVSMPKRLTKHLSPVFVTKE
jgi:hypothetical protein